MRGSRAAAVVSLCGALTTAFVARDVSRVLVQPRRVARSTMEMKVFDWKRREADESGQIRVDSQEFRVDNIRGAPGSRKKRTRKGRGIAAGQGATCGFGMRGQKSRSGRPARPGFEGGQTPLYRRVPKYVGRPMGPGHKTEIFSLIKLDHLATLQDGSEVDYSSLLDSGTITKSKYPIYKVVGSKVDDLKLPSGLTVKAHAFTKSAKAAIEAAGGTCVYLHKRTGDVLETDLEAA
mmetsp:Transcript_5356/g.16220  ORF Transcript_5356/g.16220 Transcript_5356/m.16220 type:complete len:235 (+) Transcript_5356:49-753(+)